MDKWLSIGEAARILQVTPDTVRSWEAQGRIKAHRTEGSHRRFRAEDVLNLASRPAHTKPAGRPATKPPSPPVTPADDYVDEGLLLAQEDLRSARAQLDLLKVEDQATRIVDAREQEQQRRDAEAQSRHAADAERIRLQRLRSYGLELASACRLPPSWRAQVCAELETFVTREQFPVSLPSAEAQEFIRAKVDSIVQEYRKGVEQQAGKQREEMQVAVEQLLSRREAEIEESRLNQLISVGIQRAAMLTLLWDPVEREEAREEVMAELESEVESNWSEQRVRRLVEDVIDEWDEGPPDDEEEDAGEEEEEGDDEWT